MTTSYKLRLIPLGGIVGVTKNMYVYELYEENRLKDILIIDCGIGFPKEKELGVDFVIPDISYLRDKKDKIKAIILTHGHEDHISALPYHYHDLGRPPVFTSKLTRAFVENKFREINQRVVIHTVDYGKKYQWGDFKVSFIHITHSIPDAMHIVLKTPVGTIYHGPDFKFDLTPPHGLPPDFFEITKSGNEGILCLLSDCLGVEREGMTLSEAIVGQTFENEMRSTKGKFIMTTFSSNISRIKQCVEAAVKFNRKIIFLGRSMRENTRLAKEMGYLPVPFSLIGKEEETMKLPANKVCLIVAGSQGQYDSALSKLAHKRNQYIKIKPGDKIIFSSDPVPGNENEVNTVIEKLILQGADVMYSGITEELHASGHGNKEDLKLLMRFTNPKYFIPIGGTVRHQRQYQKLAADLGYKKEHVFMLDEGETIWFSQNTASKGDLVETKNIYVDAYGVGDVGNVVLRDRKTLAKEGMVIVVLTIDQQNRILAEPKFVSRGFIYERDEEGLFSKSKKEIQSILKPKGNIFTDLYNVKREIIAALEKLFYKETGREPLVVVEIIQI